MIEVHSALIKLVEVQYGLQRVESNNYKYKHIMTHNCSAKTLISKIQSKVEILQLWRITQGVGASDPLVRNHIREADKFITRLQESSFVCRVCWNAARNSDNLEMAHSHLLKDGRSQLLSFKVSKSSLNWLPQLSELHPALISRQLTSIYDSKSNKSISIYLQSFEQIHYAFPNLPALIQLLQNMAEPTKYMRVVTDILALYQKELLRLFRKHPTQQHAQFKSAFSSTFQRLRQTEVAKSIEDGLSLTCQHMLNFLQTPLRNNKTSIDTRKGLRSQAGNRLFRMTAGFKRDHENEEPIVEEESSEVLPGYPYRVEDEIMPKMRMKWKSGYEPERRLEGKDSVTIGNNNIDLLSYTIPQIENSIRRLSLQRSPKSVKERELEVYRTLESRSMKKKYIPRLF